jgi:hypothetical protein
MPILILILILMLILILILQGSGPGEGLPEDVARAFFQQLILALDFCQQLGIANRRARCSLGPLSHCLGPPACPAPRMRKPLHAPVLELPLHALSLWAPA